MRLVRFWLLLNQAGSTKPPIIMAMKPADTQLPVGFCSWDTVSIEDASGADVLVRDTPVLAVACCHLMVQA